METHVVPVCSTCRKQLKDKKDGFIIEGQIWEAEVDDSAEVEGAELVDCSGEAEAYCRECFCKALGIRQAAMRGFADPRPIKDQTNDRGQ